jgi:hypothetical protein
MKYTIGLSIESKAKALKDIKDRYYNKPVDLKNFKIILKSRGEIEMPVIANIKCISKCISKLKDTYFVNVNAVLDLAPDIFFDVYNNLDNIEGYFYDGAYVDSKCISSN